MIKKNITCLIIICSYILESVTRFWDFPNERKKDTNRMDIPKNPSDFFFTEHEAAIR